jgi:hypothetical protein
MIGRVIPGPVILFIQKPLVQHRKEGAEKRPGNHQGAKHKKQPRPQKGASNGMQHYDFSLEGI